MQVLVEPLPEGAGYRASTGAPLHITATGATPEAALEDVGRQLAEKWERGARLYNLPGIPPARYSPPTPLDPELEEIYRQAVEEYRDQCDRDAEARYGVKIERPAP